MAAVMRLVVVPRSSPSARRSVRRAMEAAPVSYVWRHYGFHNVVRDKTFSAHETTQLAVVVRIKTFSAHVMAQIRRVVSKSGLFTHERITVSVSRVTPSPPVSVSGVTS